MTWKGSINHKEESYWGWVCRKNCLKPLILKAWIVLDPKERVSIQPIR